MTDIAIRVENLSKLYRIGEPQARHDTLRDVVSSLFRPRSSPAPCGTDTDLWALKDVSFEVKQGEVVGVIGRNGAGKSTLLKILSRITEPTSGRVTLYGRVASLLEVGTGFHPELTGRENIYLNGAILGMKRREIDGKFDEIVAFAEIERFLDTPVKRYSSGMYVRLAFAVAAHLEPEILLVDEVLAVGDAAFQKKALGKMSAVVNEGRTVLFVSHNMGAVSSLCDRCILLAGGRLIENGVADRVVSAYLSTGASALSNVSLLRHPNRSPSYQPLLTSIELSCNEGNIAYYGKPFEVRIGYDFPWQIAVPQFVIIFYTSVGNRAFTLISDYQPNDVPGSLIGQGMITCRIESLPLLPGTYVVGLRLWQPGQKLDEVESVATIRVEWLERDMGQFNWSDDMGVVYVDARWRIESWESEDVALLSMPQHQVLL